MDERLQVEMARPEGFEPPILCLEADRTLLGIPVKVIGIPG
jgi:hypothetical protein